MLLIGFCLPWRILWAEKSEPVSPASDLFPYVMPWDKGAGLMDLSSWNHCPAGKYGAIREGADGHWYAGKERMRFFGMNIVSSSAFPKHAEAMPLARRLSGFGINLVRFHHMDAPWAENIFSTSALNTRHLDADVLNRLDFFFKQLKDRGIYSDLNLLCSRQFLPSDGLPESILQLDWKITHAVGMFYAPLIKLQKEYAASLLKHVNPYTGKSYARDPAVAMIEINNENGLLQAWYSGYFDKLPEPFAGSLQMQWNKFLKERYTNDLHWREDWSVNLPFGHELLTEGENPAASKQWTVETHAASRVKLESMEGPEKKRIDAMRILNPGVKNWHIQLNQKNINLKADELYTVSFWAKAEKSATVTVYLMQAHTPWKNLGFEQSIALEPHWKKFQFVCALTAGDVQSRFGFLNMSQIGNAYSFAACSIRSGGSLAPAPSLSMEKGNVPIVRWNERSSFSQKAQSDWLDFLWAREKAYWNEMRTFLKVDLQVLARVMGTQIGTSTPYLLNEFDAQDVHGYWQHPEFIGAPFNSPWYLKNATLAAEPDGGPLTECALKRVWGKPFTVTEYNHCAPNMFDSETFLMLAGFAAFQDWDAIVGFNYSESSTRWGENNYNSFCDIAPHPGKMTSLIAAACMFRRGDVHTGLQPMVGNFRLSQEKHQLLATRAWSLVDGQGSGLTRVASLVHPVGMLLGNIPRPLEAVPVQAIGVPADGRVCSDTQELCWDTKNRYWEVHAVKTWAAIGIIQKRTFSWQGMEMTVTQARRGWGAVVLNEMTASQPHGKKRWLLTALGMICNSGMVTRTYPEGKAEFPPETDSLISITKNSEWGSAPTMAEGLTGEIVLPYPAAQVEVFALDPSGNRKSLVRVREKNGKGYFEFSPEYKSLWYEISVKVP
ncbi:MAG: hypothetical protein HGA76_02825 [Candidatus Firestonebacteria bacterium]|nr:hypothetical protein [Candidatus Firestonebacteria bacterium]